MKLTFKKRPRETGLRAVGYPNRSVDIKLSGRMVGLIAAPNWQSKEHKWAIRLAVKCDDGGGWKWVTVKSKFDTEDEAREWVQERNDSIIEMGLHQF